MASVAALAALVLVRSDEGTEDDENKLTQPAKVDMVLAMFPNFPRSTIEIDLSHTGSVEETCERILSGALVPPPTPPPTAAATAAQSPRAGAPDLAAFAPSPYLAAKPVEAEPPKKWAATPEARQMNLRQRKEFMVQQARKKSLEAQAAAAAQALAGAGSTDSSASQ
ncbi:hypothetical protein HK105_201894 [Polyrhizophydium stewartii]|uniref:CUE domain-containing protein n=1 Tax=Polyrhizophydium stewartii TaxID=2732419 RepID=A0ABR4NG29_9FUNG